MQQPGFILMPSHTGVQRHEAHTVMTLTGPCLDMLHSINMMLNMNYACKFFPLHTVMLFLHELIRSIKYMQQKLIFSEISNNCHFRWLLNEHNKPSVSVLVMLCLIYSSAHMPHHYLHACFYLFVFNLQSRQTRLKLLEP